jgi:uncharacterized repeat protein (TIGR01451 family)
MHPSSALRATLLLVLLLALLPESSRGQVGPPPPPPLPGKGPAPLLYVRFAGPVGMHVTFYQGHAPGRDYVAPVTVGLRPGYLHRVRLSALPQRPGVALAPTIEVRGTLCLPPRLRVAEFPAPVVITEDDVNRVLAGSLLTKVVYLENPELAVAAATRPDQPLEQNLPPAYDLLEEARGLGRPMVLFRMGQRDVSIDELARQSVPGTVLLPGETGLAPPRFPPQLPFACFPTVDPLSGPKPADEECLHDGGDSGEPAGLDDVGRLRGLDPSDTLAEYTDSSGRRHLACSNRVCLCVPRFAVLRSELPLAAYDTTVGPAGAQAVHQRVQLQVRVPSVETHQNEMVGAMAGRQKPTAALATQGAALLLRVEVLEASVLDVGPAAALGTAAVVRLTEVERVRLAKQLELARVLSSQQRPEGMAQTQGTAVVGRVEGLDVVSSVAETRDLTVCCQEAPHPPDRPLCLFKWASAQSAQVGDTVTFFLKYSNLGGRPISDIAVSDSLTGRLEYVAGSAKTDRPAVFTTQANEAGSVILRWEVSGRLLPGQNGVVSFQAKVR